MPYIICRVHAWGNDIKEAFVNCAHAMVNYMYEREAVDNLMDKEIEVEGTVVFDMYMINLILILICLSLYPYSYT